MLSDSPILEVEGLKKYFKTPKGMLHAVDNVTFSVRPGKTLGVVGESGCGKSTTGRAILRLIEPTAGSVRFEGQDILALNKEEMRRMRQKMQIIFQDPYSSLNPRKTVRRILREPFEVQRLGAGEALDRMVDRLCEKVDIPASLLDRYPHELDGGMRQVVGIARALAVNPQLIVCDEPVSSLDVSVQAKIINLLMDIQKEMGLSYLFISHDLSVVRHISNRIAVMYLGQIIEICDTDTMFEQTMHPYSLALLSAVPQVNAEEKVSRILLKGDVPSPMDPKPGCRFAPRCWMARERCFTEGPQLREAAPNHHVACHYAHQSRERMKQAATSSLDREEA